MLRKNDLASAESKPCCDKMRVYSFIGLARKAGAVIMGESMASRAIKNGDAFLIIVAEDCSNNTKKKIETALYGSTVPWRRFGTGEELGHMLGKAFLSVIAITDRGFSGRIIEMIDKGIWNDNTAHGGGFFEQTKNS